MYRVLSKPVAADHLRQRGSAGGFPELRLSQQTNVHARLLAPPIIGIIFPTCSVLSSNNTSLVLRMAALFVAAALLATRALASHEGSSSLRVS